MSKAGQRCFERSDMATLARVVAKTSRCARKPPFLRFAAIPQPWLRDLAKRWVRWRLSTGLCLDAGGGRPPGG
jgi:hypothetical protein